MNLQNRNVSTTPEEPSYVYEQLHPNIRVRLEGDGLEQDKTKIPGVYNTDAESGISSNGGTYFDVLNLLGNKDKRIRNIVGSTPQARQAIQDSFDPATGKYESLNFGDRFGNNISDDDISKRLAIDIYESNQANPELTRADLKKINTLSTGPQIQNIVGQRKNREGLQKSLGDMILPTADNEQYGELSEQYKNRSNLTNAELTRLQTRLKDFQPVEARLIKSAGLRDANLEQSTAASILQGKQQGNRITNEQRKMQNENILARAELTDRGNQRRHEAGQQNLQNIHNAEQANLQRQLELAIREQSFNDAAAERQLRRDLQQDNEMTKMLQFLFSGGQNFRNIIGN